MIMCIDGGYLQIIILKNEKDKNFADCKEKGPSAYTFFESLWRYHKY